MRAGNPAVRLTVSLIPLPRVSANINTSPTLVATDDGSYSQVSMYPHTPIARQAPEAKAQNKAVL